MKCATCGKQIEDNGISALGGRDFCSDICHLRFWKDEMPNLGGRWIGDENLKELEQLTGQIREDEYNRIVNFIMNNFNNTAFMLQLRYGKGKEKPEEK